MTEEEKAAAQAAAEAAAKAAADAAAKTASDAAKKIADDEAAAKAAAAGKTTVDDDTAKLLKELMAYKQRAKDAEDKAKIYEGIDPEAARKALAAQVEAERKSLEDKGEYKRILEQVNEANGKTVADKDKAIAAKDAEVETLKSQINRLSIGNSFGASTFIAEELVLTSTKAEVLYGNHFEVEDGKVIAYDKPRGQADRTPLVNGKGESLGFEDAIKKIVQADPDFERMKRSAMKKGAGSETDDKGTGDDGKTSVTGMSRIKLALAGKK